MGACGSGEEGLVMTLPHEMPRGCRKEKPKSSADTLVGVASRVEGR